MKFRPEGSRHILFQLFNKLKLSQLIGILIVTTSLLATSCVQNEPSGKRRSTSSQGASTGDNTTPETPIFEGEANYLQNGNNKSSTTLVLSGDFNTSLYLRGSQVDKFIKLNNQNNVQCLAVPYPNSAIQKVLVMAAYPKFFFNFTTNTQEYYYLVEPANTANNSTFCQQPGTINALANDFPNSSPVYDLSSVCPNCSLSVVLSNPLQLFTQGGAEISEVTLVNLRLEVRPENTTDTPTNLTCTTSAECPAKGFDCCSFGQCVNDKQVRSNVDQDSASFQQALLDIQNNPSAIFNYTEFFHICGSNISPDPDPTPRPDPNIEAAERFKELKALYDCTTPIEGEMAICQSKYTDVQQTISSSGSNQFETGADDRNFNTIYSGTSTLPKHSLFEVKYAGEILYEDGAIIKGMTIGPNGNGTGNDNLDDTQVLNLTQTPAASAPNDELVVKYKIDGSCTKISSFLAKCFKVYVQGQNEGKVTDHFPASNNFILPFYADTNKTITVTVDEADSLQFSDWNLVQTTPARIEFTGDDLAVFDTQIVKINYFVSLQNYPNVLLKKQEAQDEIDTICECGGLDCSLKPKLDSNGATVDFTCFYPEPDLPPPPLQQTVLVSAKSAPHRFFDKDGVYQETAEDSNTEQEGNEFLYTNNNLERPNNVDTYIGFNEIYGSFTTKSGSALPAKEVRVVAGKTYDIFTDDGSYSSCFFCGTDYYSSLARIFPQSFLSNGGGYTPELSQNNPLSTRTYRKDDLLFGRACFVPATMIPFTHIADSSRSTQRQKRLAAQHFLFANGYNRDWYGFDYGSVIGSFDGVRWFSIGNQRRIQARTNKLFIAINSYFGDLTDNTTYSVTVQDTSTVSGAGALVNSDFESDGAECQQNHVCESDADCASQLGWDYVCESVTNIETQWPRFDTNALEVPGASDTQNLRNLFGATTGSTRRCVYRGRGAACIQNYTVNENDSTFTGTAQPPLHACANNYHCQPFIEGVAVEKFNNKIARYGKSIKVQNASEFVEEDDLDVVGLGARIIGRPYAWLGTDSIPTDAQTNLSQNNVTAMCIPGRDSNDDTFGNNHTATPTSEAIGDQINNMGVTPDLTEGTTGSRPDYTARCSIFDSAGNYLHNQRTNTSLGSDVSTLLMSDPEIEKLSSRQAISTNSLAIFESPQLTGNQIIKNFEEEFIDEIFYQENRCLRAPGSTCFSALDCAPNPFISDKVANLNVDDTSVTSLINRYEIQFWKEELVCSQEFEPNDDEFELGNNRCCRETNRTLTIGTSLVDGDFTSNKDLDFASIPGVNTSISSSTRNSRLTTVWDLIQTDNTTFPRLKSVRDDSCSSGCGNITDLENQSNTFAEIGQRTCCSKNWIRNFHPDDNGGGHKWGPDKTQQIPKDSFRCYNYIQCNDADGECGDENGDSFFGFTCSHTDEPDDPKCLARSIPSPEADRIFAWLGTLELTGIPQVAIKSEDDSDLHCTVDPDDQSALSSLPAPNIINPASVKEYSDGGQELFSSTDSTNFITDNIRQVFSPDQITCCKPAGTVMPADADPDECCTGYIGNNRTCQLPDYSNVSLYLNKFVSSEAQEEPVGAFDSRTGYLKSPFDVIRIACKKRICESNSLVEGVALSNLRTRGHPNNDKQRQRFIDGDDEVNSQNGLSVLYDRGFRWNTHLYCNDLELENSLPGTIDCGSL